MIVNLSVFENIPAGWSKLSGATTAPIGYLFISNGKSRFSKEYRCGLVKDNTQREFKREIDGISKIAITSNRKENEPVKKSGVCFADEPNLPEKLNTLAREEMKLRLLQDIQMDICVCQIEGIDYKSYLMELKAEIDRFLNL